MLMLPHPPKFGITGSSPYQAKKYPLYIIYSSNNDMHIKSNTTLAHRFRAICVNLRRLSVYIAVLLCVPVACRG